MKHKYEIRDSVIEDVFELAPKLRDADVAEIKAASDKTPKEALMDSFQAAHSSKTGLIDGEAVCMFGVSQLSILSWSGVPWLLASDMLVKHAKPFLRRSREYVESLKRDYDYLANFVHAENIEAIKWLKWLGFDILEKRNYGPYGAEFHLFEMKG